MCVASVIASARLLTRLHITLRLWYEAISGQQPGGGRPHLPIEEGVDYDEEEPTPSIFLLCIYLRGINTNLSALCRVDNVKLKVALPRTRPHMCNGNVAPQRTGSPANPHEWEQKLTSSLAFRECGYVN